MRALPQIPIILVQNYDFEPPITTYYLHRNNEIHLKDFNITNEKLATHPGRGKLAYVVDPETRKTRKWSNLP
jgi:hypothetical protein